MLNFPFLSGSRTSDKDAAFGTNASHNRNGHSTQGSAEIAGSNDSNCGTLNKTLPCSIISGLWALARSPGFLNAVESEETRDGGQPRLSHILKELARDEVLTKKTHFGEAMKLAGEYFATCHVQQYERMSPLDVIRAIVGLCGDLEAVLERTCQATYLKEIRCSRSDCGRKEASPVTEVELRCSHQTVQEAVDARAISKVVCEACGQKSANEVSPGSPFHVLCSDCPTCCRLSPLKCSSTPVGPCPRISRETNPRWCTPLDE